jgi:hypothetical protein
LGGAAEEAQWVINRLAEQGIGSWPDDFLACYQGTLSQYRSMCDPVLETDEHPSAEAWVRAQLYVMANKQMSNLIMLTQKAGYALIPNAQTSSLSLSPIGAYILDNKPFSKCISYFNREADTVAFRISIVVCETVFSVNIADISPDIGVVKDVVCRA